MKNRYRAIIRTGIGLAAAVLLSGCTGTGQPESVTESGGEVVIPVIFTVDATSGNKSNQELVEAFNEAYQGVYRVEVEWILETEEEYRQNLKRLNATDELPAVITDLRMLPSFYRMMIADQRIINLSPYIEADREWQEAIEPEVLAGCTEADGSVYLAATATASLGRAGVFWNEELFDQAGIEAFPQTWEEFWACCGQLQEAGIIPLALHTEGTAWAPMLFATAELAAEDDGLAFIRQDFPDSYCNRYGQQLAESLKRLLGYTTENAVHTDFDTAFTNFFSGKTAMIPNGYWMIDQMPEEWRDRVRFSPFPGNAVISSPETFGWAVVSSYSEEVQRGAVEFLKFRTLRTRAEQQQFLESGGSGGGQVTRDYIAMLESQPRIVPNYQIKWNSIFQEETLGETLPLLMSGELTPEQFTVRADQSIRRFKEEQ